MWEPVACSINLQKAPQNTPIYTWYLHMLRKYYGATDPKLHQNRTKWITKLIHKIVRLGKARYIFLSAFVSPILQNGVGSILLVRIYYGHIGLI